MTERLSRHTLAVVMALVVGSTRLVAQPIAPRGSPWRTEARIDALIARQTSVQAGIGLAREAGTYVRLVGVAAAGATWRDGRAVSSGRIEAVTRFTLDPFAERRTSLYGGAGIGLLFTDGERVRPVLSLGIGVEGAASRRIVPALELGLGGGARVGVVLRGGRRAKR